MLPLFHSSWPDLNQFPELGPGVVHIWSFRTSRPPGEVETLARLLNDEELARARRMRSLEVREQTLVGRAVCRKFLGAYLNQDPARLEFDQTGMGKPILHGRPELHFNLTHSHGIALLAITRLAEVGVDIELVRLLPNTRFLAERFFSGREASELSAYQGEELAQVFFQTWTRKEAFLKANGSGIGFGLDRVEVSFGHGETPRIRFIDGSESKAKKWTVIHLEPGKGFMGAVALEAPVVAIKTGFWNGGERLFP